MRRVTPLQVVVAVGSVSLLALLVNSRGSNSNIAPTAANPVQSASSSVQPMQWEDDRSNFGSSFGHRSAPRRYATPYASLPARNPSQSANRLVAQHSPAAPDPLNGWRMAGKVEANGRRGATLENSTTRETMTVWEGDEWRGMKIASIGDDGIHFDDKGTMRQLTQNGSIPPQTEVAQSFATGNDQGIEVTTGDLSGALDAQFISVNSADGNMSFTLGSDLKGVRLNSGAVMSLKFTVDTTAHDNAAFEGKQPPAGQAAELFILQTEKQRSRFTESL